MKIITIIVIAAFTFSGPLTAQPENDSMTKYSISNVHNLGKRTIKKAVMGMTVEHFTSYEDELEYDININVQQNRIEDMQDSILILKCFFSESAVTNIEINLDSVEWISNDNFIYTFPLAVDQSGWVYFYILTPQEKSQISQQQIYQELKLNHINKVLWLDSIKN